MNYKKIKNNKVFKIILALIGIIVIYVFIISKIDFFNYKIINVKKNTIQKKEIPVNIQIYKYTKTNKIEKKSTEEKKKIKNLVTLKVLGKIYKTEISEGDSVYSVMEKLSKSKEYNFSFNSKNYSSLGIFINEINGIKGASGKYWIYYINNKKASVGVSKYILKPNDTIIWKQKSE